MLTEICFTNTLNRIQLKGNNMGYTHYFEFKGLNKLSSQTFLSVERNYENACARIHDLVSSYYKECGGLSGYTPHTNFQDYKGVNFNGAGEKGHENFTLREDLREYIKEGEGFNFCKTARKPYDALVCASLILLKHYMGDFVRVTSDGEISDYNTGKEILNKFYGSSVFDSFKLDGQDKTKFIDLGL